VFLLIHRINLNIDQCYSDVAVIAEICFPDEAECTVDPTKPFRLFAKEKQKGLVVVDNCNDDAEGYKVKDTSEYEDETIHKAERLSKEGILKENKFGKRVMAKAAAIGKEFGKHWRVILIETGLVMKATHKVSAWNQHEAWFLTVLPPFKEHMLLYSWLFCCLLMTF